MSEEFSAAVITVSTRASQGVYEDKSGPILAEGLRKQGYSVGEIVLIPDDFQKINHSIMEKLDAGTRLIVTTGGTGVSPSDVTPEATAPIIEKLLPGLSESLRSYGRSLNPKASLSRGLSGVTGKSLIINLPGSPGGVRDGLKVISDVAQHIIEQIDGKDHVS